ncbi:MAG: hypothetical protein H6702_04150 [Myxococcales bacterium]|nr:hypothetical protein [Myxococcales bacterium]
MGRGIGPALLLAASLAAGCGVQAHLGPHQAQLSGGHNGFTKVEGYDQSLTTMGFAVYDATGMILAALTGAGSVAQAQNAGGGTVVFRAPVPGLWTMFEYTVGSADGFDYRLGAARMNIHTWQLSDAEPEHKLGWGLGFYGVSYTANDNTEDAWALPLSLAWTLPVLPGLTTSLSASLDPLNPVLAGGTGGEYWFSYEASARLDWMALDWLGAFALGQARQTPADTGETQTRDLYLQFGLMAFFGDRP